MAQHTNEEACEFIKAKAVELAEYMESLGFDRAVKGSVLLGLGAGWVAAVRGNEAAFQGMDMARASIERATGALGREH